jgi:hypothetical protein
VLRFPLIHPPLLSALARAGHGGRARQPDEGGTPEARARYRELLGYVPPEGAR